jgi:hypothetical protein
LARLRPTALLPAAMKPINAMFSRSGKFSSF